MRSFRLAGSLNLPLDAVTQKIAWFGRTGSGKTFACKRLVEQMLEQHDYIVVEDESA